MRTRNYPGDLTREEWRALPYAERRVLASRAQSDLLRLWHDCKKRACRRARRCSGDGERCKARPWSLDPALFAGRPDSRCAFRLPDNIRQRWAELDILASA